MTGARLFGIFEAIFNIASRPDITVLVYLNFRATKYVLDPIGNPTLTGAGTRSDGTTQKFTFEKAAILSIPNAGSLTG